MLRRRRHLRTLLIAAWAAGLALPGSAAAASSSFSGTLLIHFPLKASQPFPCSGPGICGAGTLHGLGAVQITIDNEQLTPIPNSDCFYDQRAETINVLDGSGTIALDSTGTACPPGASSNAPDSSNAFGNPSIFDLTFTVDGANSTGAYQSATGSGTDRFQFAGATGVWMLTGTITTS
jgi:hypothetical protein